MVCGVIAGVATSRRGRSISVSVGLLLSADAFVQAGGGMIDLHFHYFVVIALIGLYQDWIPFAIAVVLVAVQPSARRRRGPRPTRTSTGPRRWRYA